MRYELYYAEKKPVHMILKEMSETMCDDDLMKFVEDRCCDKRTLKDGSPLDIAKLRNDPDMELIAIIDKDDYCLPLVKHEGSYKYKDGANHLEYCQDMKILVYEIFDVRVSLEFEADRWSSRVIVVLDWIEGDFRIMARRYKFPPTLDKVAVKDFDVLKWGDDFYPRELILRKIIRTTNKKINDLSYNKTNDITKFIDLLTL